MLFRFKREIRNNCVNLWKQGLELDANRFRNTVYYFQNCLEIGLTVDTRVPKTYIPHIASMNKEEWLTYESILTQAIAEIKMLQNLL